MLRLFLYITTLFCFSCAFAQKKEFLYEKDLGWAKWVFTSIEFNDDYTTVRGHFIPGENGCWVSTDKTEVLLANGKEHRILETTLPKDIILVKKTFQGGDTIMFVEKFEPIMKQEGTVSYKSETFQFDIGDFCIDIKPDIHRKYSTYAKRIKDWKKDAVGWNEYLRYLSHCAEELSLMPKDSAALARTCLGNCYNVYDIFMNSYPGRILKTWRTIREIHYGMTGKRMRRSEWKYLDSVAEFSNEVSWKSKILTDDNLEAMRRKVEKVFRKADKEMDLYKRTLALLGDSSYNYIAIPNFRWLNDTYRQALGMYNAGDYAGAYGIFPFSIHFRYKFQSREDFKEYCNTLHEDYITTLTYNINIPQTITLSYGSMYSDVLGVTEITPLLETMPYFARETNDPEFICHALDGILNAKAFRYYADRYMKEHLGGFNGFNRFNGFNETAETSETTETPLSLYHKVQSESAALTEMYENGQSYEDVFQKAEEIKRLKEQWIDLQKRNPISTADFLVKWDSVRNSLKPNELAVEFQDFPLWNTDSVCYIAITYKHDSSVPRLYTVLKDRKDVLSGFNKGFNSFNGFNETAEALETPEPPKSYAISSKIWDAMKDELADAESVYFSPSGILHSLPLESCDTTRLYYRLTSTKELLKRQEHLNQQLQTCVLYGGLEYGSNSFSGFNRFNGFNETSETIDLPAPCIRFGSRGPLDDISEQSEAEVDTIASLLQEKGVEAIVFKRQYGTEETFKALDGTNVDAIHISTHGFYWELDRVAADEKAFGYSFLKLEDSRLSDNEKAMVRSALLLAGAQEAMEGVAKKQGKENGVLTAREISTMTFPNLKFVVLSACQSGLGDVDASEGALGLQRAFKMAGAKTILMTLREVDNHATRLFMEEFYRQYLSGKSMTHALRNAQNFLRNYEEDGTTPYKDPKYWAYFTLLDALP